MISIEKFKCPPVATCQPRELFFWIDELEINIYLFLIDLILLFSIILLLGFITYNIINLKKSPDLWRIKKRIFLFLKIIILFSLIIYVDRLISIITRYTIII